MGQFLGEEVNRVMREMDPKRMATGGKISAAQKMISFPGRDRIGQGRAGIEGQYKDGADVAAHPSATPPLSDETLSFARAQLHPFSM